jgi:hypothetical protein
MGRRLHWTSTTSEVRWTISQRFDNDPTGMSERDLQITYEATLAAFVRGFAAALQLRRVVDS